MRAAMTGRDFWMAVHRYSGLAVVVFLVFAALSGTLLVWMRPLDGAINADLFRQDGVAHAPEVAPLLDRFAARHPQIAVKSFPLAVPADRRIPVTIAADDGAGEELFLDRASGAIAGRRASAPAFDRRGLVELIHEAHSNLLLGTGGRWFMGAMALAWLLGNLVGIYLTLPVRGAFWKTWKRSWKFSFKSVFARQMLDFHRASGLWLLLPLSALALTSVCLNFFAEGYAPLVERFVPERAQALPDSAVRGKLDFAGAVAAARQVAQTMARATGGEPWKPATVIAERAEGRIAVTLTRSGVLRYTALGPIYLYFDAANGRLVEVVDPYHGNTNLALYRWLYPVHSGHVAGLASELAVFGLGWVIAAMGATGVYLWWKKRPGRILRRRARKGVSR